MHALEDHAASLTAATARSRWVQLLARIYEVFPLRCPECGSEMRVLAFLTKPEPVSAILRCLELPHTAPRLSPARAPPQAALELATDPVAPVDPLPADDFDQTPAFDPTAPEPVPELGSIRPAAPDGRAASGPPWRKQCPLFSPRFGLRSRSQAPSPAPLHHP